MGWDGVGWGGMWDGMWGGVGMWSARRPGAHLRVDQALLPILVDLLVQLMIFQSDGTPRRVEAENLCHQPIVE